MGCHAPLISILCHTPSSAPLQIRADYGPGSTEYRGMNWSYFSISVDSFEPPTKLQDGREVELEICNYAVFHLYCACSFHRIAKLALSREFCSIMECRLYSCSNNEHQICIPDKKKVVLGRGPLTKIKEKKCSRKQG